MIMGMEEVKLKILQDKYNAVKAENDAIFEREMLGEVVPRSEWLDAKQRLERAEKELDEQKLKVQVQNGDVMSDEEIEEIFGKGSGHGVDDDDEIRALIDNWNL